MQALRRNWQMSKMQRALRSSKVSALQTLPALNQQTPKSSTPDILCQMTIYFLGSAISRMSIGLPRFKYNLLRAVSAGIVWCILELMACTGSRALPMVIAFPIGYFIFPLPVGLVTGWLSVKGVPWVGLVNFFFALMLFLGDPPCLFSRN